jgi:hypothetical protein
MKRMRVLMLKTENGKLKIETGSKATAMIVEKVQDTAMDGLAVGTIMIWRGEWLRSPAECAGRDRDPIPVLYHPDGRPGPMSGASDWVDVATSKYPEGW